jgi:hypothetical protein
MRVVGNAYQIVLWETFNGFTSRWRKIDTKTLDNIGERALLALTDAGLIEMRFGVAAKYIGFHCELQAIFEVCGAGNEAELNRKIFDLANEALGVVSQKPTRAKTRIEVFPMAGRLTGKGVSFHPPHYSQEDVMGMMGLLIHKKLPHHTASVSLVDYRLYRSSATSNEDRDGWLYEQCCQLIRYSRIMEQLAHRWPADEAIQSIQGIKRAANRYARTHHLPPIPSRQRGRPPRQE